MGDRKKAGNGGATMTDCSDIQLKIFRLILDER